MGRWGSPGYAPGSMMADMFQTKGYDIVSDCTSSWPEGGPDWKGAEFASYLVYESERCTTVLCCLGETASGLEDARREG